jgi:hypothetical protein
MRKLGSHLSNDLAATPRKSSYKSKKSIEADDVQRTASKNILNIDENMILDKSENIDVVSNQSKKRSPRMEAIDEEDINDRRGSQDQESWFGNKEKP